LPVRVAFADVPRRTGRPCARYRAGIAHRLVSAGRYTVGDLPGPTARTRRDRDPTRGDGRCCTGNTTVTRGGTLGARAGGLYWVIPLDGNRRAALWCESATYWACRR